MILVIDANNLGYASAYATGELTYEAQPTGVLYGFLNQIFKLAEEFCCEKFIFCWDSRKSYRKLIYPSYKSARHNKELTFEEQRNLKIVHKQFDLLRRKVLPSLGFRNVYIQTGYEADDLIAHLKTLTDNEILTVVSTDNDLWQLLDKKTDIYNPRSKTHLYEGSFIKNWNIEPKDWVKVKAIAGCKTDSIMGIRGVGELTAVKYLLGNLGSNTKAYSSIKASEDIIKKNIELVKLPFSNGLRPIRLAQPVFPVMWTLDFIDVFGEYGFGSFLKEDRFLTIEQTLKLEKGRET